MPRVKLRTLERPTAGELRRFVTAGYVSPSRFVVEKVETRRGVAIRVRRERLKAPFVKQFAEPKGELQRYQGIVRMGWSVGAYVGKKLVGIAIAEPRAWNRSLWVWELDVARDCRRRGIGRRLVGELARRGRAGGLRVLVCETQTTNVPAIDFYRATGFVLDGLDLSYYTNDDLVRGEVAVFMKKKLE
jgi:ribosomal protein S18 acetylase RimI-like enzyme